MEPIKLRYQPRSLMELSRITINKKLEMYNGISQLEIPNTLKSYLGEHYLRDKCLTRWCDISPHFRKFIDHYTFDRLHIDVGPDIFLTIMNMNPHEVPACAHTWTDVTYQWWEEIGNIYDERYCGHCARFMPNMRRCRHQDRIEKESVLTDILQGSWSWCEGCHTTTLFKLKKWDYPAYSRRWSTLLDFSSSDDE